MRREIAPGTTRLADRPEDSLPTATDCFGTITLGIDSYPMHGLAHPDVSCVAGGARNRYRCHADCCADTGEHRARRLTVREAAFPSNGAPVGAGILGWLGEPESIAAVAVWIAYPRAQLDELVDIGVIDLERGVYRVTDIPLYRTHQLRASPIRVTVVPRSQARVAAAASVVEEGCVGVP